jgi:hypothetical protein
MESTHDVGDGHGSCFEKPGTGLGGAARVHFWLDECESTPALRNKNNDRIPVVSPPGELARTLGPSGTSR